MQDFVAMLSSLLTTDISVLKICYESMIVYKYKEIFEAGPLVLGAVADTTLPTPNELAEYNELV